MRFEGVQFFCFAADLHSSNAQSALSFFHVFRTFTRRRVNENMNTSYFTCVSLFDHLPYKFHPTKT